MPTLIIYAGLAPARKRLVCVIPRSEGRTRRNCLEQSSAEATMIPRLACRLAYSGDAAVGHDADARQRASAMLLRLLHLRHRRSAALGRNSTTALLLRRGPVQ